MASGALLQRIIVSTSSLSRALELYEDVLGLRREHISAGFAWLRTADGAQLLFHERPSQSSDAAMAAAFAIEELDDAVAAWAKAGGSVVDPPAEQPWGERMAVVRDADGHIVCLVEGR